MKTKLLAILIVFLYQEHNCKAQIFSTNWVSPIGGQSYDFGIANCIDYENNVYTLGVFSDSLVLKDGQTKLFSNGRTDYYIIKHDANGEIIWAKSFGGTDYDGAVGIFSIQFQVVPIPADIKVDNDGNIYVLGNFKDTVDFDLGASEYFLNSIDGTSGFLLKLTTAGDFILAYAFNNTYFTAITLNNDMVLLAGTFSEAVDFDSGPEEFIFTSTEDGDAFLLKLTLGGEFENCIQLFSSQYVGINSITIGEESAAIYISGFYNSDLDFDTSVSSNSVNELSAISNSDGFVAKLSLDLSIVEWVTQLNASMDCASSALTLTSSNDIIISGQFRDSLILNINNIDIPFISNGHYDSFIIKMNQLGEILQVLTFGNSNPNYIRTHVSGASERIFIIGGLQNSIQIPFIEGVISLENEGFRSSYILIIDDDFNYINHFTVAGSENICDIECISIGLNNEINLTGSFTDDPYTSYDPTLNLAENIGSYDAIQIQVSEDITLSNLNSKKEPRITIYPNPFFDELNILSNTQIVSAKVFDLSGHEVSVVLLKNTKIGKSIFLDSTIPSGLYTIQIQTDKNIYYGKAVKH